MVHKPFITLHNIYFSAIYPFPAAGCITPRVSCLYPPATGVICIFAYIPEWLIAVRGHIPYPAHPVFEKGPVCLWEVLYLKIHYSGPIILMMELSIATPTILDLEIHPETEIECFSMHPHLTYYLNVIPWGSCQLSNEMLLTTKK